jgi:hypothetical protein
MEALQAVIRLFHGLFGDPDPEQAERVQPPRINQDSGDPTEEEYAARRAERIKNLDPITRARHDNIDQYCLPENHVPAHGNVIDICNMGGPKQDAKLQSYLHSIGREEAEREFPGKYRDEDLLPR